MSKKLLENNQEKFNFIINELKLEVNEIASKFGVTTGTVSGWRKEYNNKELKPMYLYALESAYGVPYKIFEDTSINTKEQVKALLHKEKSNISVFQENERLLKALVGTWYAYLYPSNLFADIYHIKTTINTDGTVIDENGNWGELKLGKNQSMIIKEADNSKNLISMTFDNIQVRYGMFHFSLVSKRNIINRELFNYGFLSRKKIDNDIATKILGDKQFLQIKIQYDLVERIAEYIDWDREKNNKK